MINTTITEHGAVPDPALKNTAAIQRALDACAAAGGGTVRFPMGEWLSGPLRAGSGVEVLLEAGATLRASPDPEDYGGRPGEKGRGTFLSASGARCLSLVGPGTIRGQGTGNYRGKDPRRGKLDPEPMFRVKTVCLDDCEGVRIRSVTFRDSDSWTLHLRRCRGVEIEGVTILNNLHRMNSDGIDPDSCRNVRIRDCNIVAGDDCIVLKSTGPEPCEDIEVSGCVLETTCTAIKIGTESHGDFRDIRFRDCTIRNSSSGIGIHVKDGATVERVSFDNISYEEQADDPVRYVASPLLIDLERRHADSRLGRIRHLAVRGFRARARAGILVQGMPERPLEDLVLEDVRMEVTAPMDFGERMKRVGGVRTTSDERDTLHARKPSYCSVAHVRGLKVRGLRVDIPEAVFRAQPRSALWLERVTDAAILGVARTPAGEGDAMVVADSRPAPAA